MLKLEDLVKVVKEYCGGFDEKEVRRALSQIREELLNRKDELKDKEYHQGWGDIFKGKIKYMDQGFFTNLRVSVNKEDNREAIIKYIEDIERSESREEAYDIYRDLSNKRISNFGNTAETSLGHILKPDWFIPTTYKIQEALRDIGYEGEGLEGTLTEERAEGSIKIFQKLEELQENFVKIAFALNNYRNKTVNKKGEKITEEEVNYLMDDIGLNKKLKNKIEELLNSKKQVILHGPPGTGKTWIARNYIKSSVRKEHEYKKDVVSEGQSFFWLVFNPKIVDPADFRQRSELEIVRNGYTIRRAFEEIKDGDIVFVYFARNIKSVYAFGEYMSKGEENKLIKIKQIEGPKWDEIKDDAILSESKPVKMRNQGTLMPLSQNEGKRLIEKIGQNLFEEYISFDKDNIEKYESSQFVTFHQSYAYEEFIEGLKPVTNEEGNIQYEIEDGIFKKICRDAFNALLTEGKVDVCWEDGKSVPELKEDEKQRIFEILRKEDYPKFYLLIDEINRGDISRVFGELITLIEPDKRLFSENELTPTLPYSKTKFGVPPNLFIIGTMNTADRSIALIDVALRRRFGFMELMPDYSLLKDKLLREEQDEKVYEIKEMAIRVVENINEGIQDKYDRDHQIGHSYLLKLENFKDELEVKSELQKIWFYEILPLLKEYFYESPNKLYSILNHRFVKKEKNYYYFVGPEDMELDHFINSLSGIANLGSEASSIE
ncbi:MAG: AAA family ATPase [Promethearchaeota archaeon]